MDFWADKIVKVTKRSFDVFTGDTVFFGIRPLACNFGQKGPYSDTLSFDNLERKGFWK